MTWSIQNIEIERAEDEEASLAWVKVDSKKKVSTNTAQPQNQRWVTVKKWGLSEKKG